MEKDQVSNEEATSKILMILARHVGEEKAIDMGELYSRVFDEPYTHKINNTRRLRTVITALRQKGVPIGSTAAKNGGGYYLVRAGPRSGSRVIRWCWWRDGPEASWTPIADGSGGRH